MRWRTVVSRLQNRVGKTDAEEVLPNVIDRCLGEIGFLAEVTQSASTVCVCMPSFQAGSSPVRNFAEAYSFLSAILIFRRLAPFLAAFGRPLNPSISAKNAANSQNCCCFHLAKGCLWHWAHSILTPMKTRAVAPAMFSALFSLAKKKAAGEKPPWLFAWAVITSCAILSKPGVSRQLVAQPTFELRLELLRLLIVGARQDHAAVIMGEVVDEMRAGEQLVDPLFKLGGAVIFQIVPYLQQRGDAAGQIDVQAPSQFGIAGASRLAGFSPAEAVG